MPWPGERRRRLAFLLRRRTLERDLAEEMRFHLDRRTEDGQNAGLSEQEARWAQRQFRDLLRVRETASDASGWARLDRLQEDLAWALRTLRRSPGFALASVLTRGGRDRGGAGRARRTGRVPGDRQLPV
jgi:hypothetical protein